MALPATLQLGCGQKKRSDAINVDIVPSVEPDVIHDLNCRPWPFPDNAFREVVALDVIEHLSDVVATMEEIHRVAAHGAVLTVTVPHFSAVNAFTDPTHRHFFSTSSFNYFTGENEFQFYSAARFRRRVSTIVFYPTLLDKVVRRLANRWPATYERRWAWIFPAWFLYFELEVVKPEPRVQVES
jgi:SAM-dependent methyltransferase